MVIAKTSSAYTGDKNTIRHMWNRVCDNKRTVEDWNLFKGQEYSELCWELPGLQPSTSESRELLEGCLVVAPAKCCDHAENEGTEVDEMQVACFCRVHGATRAPLQLRQWQGWRGAGIFSRKESIRWSKGIYITHKYSDSDSHWKFSGRHCSMPMNPGSLQ